MLDFLKKWWNVVTELSAWIGIVIGGFWREPPVSTSQTTSTLGSFGQFFLTLAIGLMAIPVYRYRQRRHSRAWVVTGLTLVVLTPVAYFLHNWYATAWTCPYAGTLVVVGPDAELTDHGKKYKADNPDLTCEQILWNHAGNTGEVWAKNSIDRRWLTLAV